MNIYAIYATGFDGSQEMELTDSPNFLKRSNRENNVLKWQNADGYEDAQIVSLHGDFYNIEGKPPVEDDSILGSAVIVEKSFTVYIDYNREKIEETADDLVMTKEDLETALCDIDFQTEDRIAQLENAICEFDTMLN